MLTISYIISRSVVSDLTFFVNKIFLFLLVFGSIISLFFII